MTTIYHDGDAELGALEGSSVAVVGYGNQGRSWALNLRDSGFDVRVCVRADASREQAVTDGFLPVDLEQASDADVVCILIPDDVIPTLELTRPADGLTIVASGYTLAFGRLDPDGDVGMVAPRMLGPEVRACYEEGIGFITAVGVHRDVTGHALARTLAVAKAIGGLRQGAIELTPRQEAILDLAEEQVLRARHDPHVQHLCPVSARARHPARGDRRGDAALGRDRAHDAPRPRARLRVPVRLPLADEPVRPALPSGGVRRDRPGGEDAASCSTTSRRDDLPTSGTPSAMPGTPC